MDWQKEIERFGHLSPAGTGMFAPPREMEQAIATYNKAVDLLGLDSFDIALIALKRLAASYPMFAQAAMLLGCCQMLMGQFAEASEHFDHARLLDMLHDEHELAEQYLNEARKQQELQEQLLIQEQRNGRSDKSKGRSRAGIIGKKKQDELEQIIPERDIPAQAISSIPSTGAPILQPTGRKQRVRMASEKEKQDVIRRAEFPEEEETHIVFDKDIFDYLRKIIPIGLIVLAAAALIWGGVVLADFISSRNDGPDAQDRLEWLETRLGDMADDNDDVLALLQDYNSFINPPDTEASSVDQKPTETTSVEETTTAEPATEVTTTAATESTISQEEMDKQKLELAFSKYSEAFELQNNDAVEAAKILQELKINIADIPDETNFTTEAPAAEDEATISSAQLKSDVDSLFSTVAVRAADSLRLSGRALFDQSDYETALEDYLLAFSLDPNNFRGNVAYYCGRCYQELERFDEAKPYFEYVVENFPNSELAGYAANRISMMGF